MDTSPKSFQGSQLSPPKSLLLHPSCGDADADYAKTLPALETDLPSALVGKHVLPRTEASKSLFAFGRSHMHLWAISMDDVRRRASTVTNHTNVHAFPTNPGSAPKP